MFLSFGMKIITLSFLLLVYQFVQAQLKPVPFSLAEVSYPITGMKKSPGAGLLFVSLSGGRFLLFDAGKSRLHDQSAPLWKNFSVEGFEYGGNAFFSGDEKYILVLEKRMLYNYDKVQVKPFRCVVLETSTGSVTASFEEVLSAQFTGKSNELLLFNEDEIIKYNLQSKQKETIQSPLGIEAAAVNQSGNLLAISYDAGKEEFKTKHGAGYNRKEVKNALKNKKLIAFYEYPSLKHKVTLSEEVDVVFEMEFTADDRFLLFYSRTRQAEHSHSSGLNSTDKMRDLNQFQRVDMNTFVVDNLNFIYQTSESQANHDLDISTGLFVYGDNRGFLSAKREVVAVNFYRQQEYLGKYTYQGRTGTRNLYSTAFAIMDPNTILVANGMKLSYWDFKLLPEYAEFIEPMNENALLDQAVAQLNADLDNPESKLSENIAKKKISGLYIFTFTVQKSGEVASIFTQSDDKTNISFQNMLKDLMMKYRFDITVPKNERIKFTYTFNL